MDRFRPACSFAIWLGNGGAQRWQPLIGACKMSSPPAPPGSPPSITYCGVGNVDSPNCKNKYVLHAERPRQPASRMREAGTRSAEGAKEGEGMEQRWRFLSVPKETRENLKPDRSFNSKRSLLRKRTRAISSHSCGREALLAGFLGSAIPVIGVGQIAFNPVQIGMHPGAAVTVRLPLQKRRGHRPNRRQPPSIRPEGASPTAAGGVPRRSGWLLNSSKVIVRSSS